MNLKTDMRVMAALFAGVLWSWTPFTASAATVVQTVAYDYSPEGFLTKQIIEPDNSNQCLVVASVLDGYGNPSTRLTRNCNGSKGTVAGKNDEAAAPSSNAVIKDRTDTFTFTNPRFLNQVADELGHVSKWNFESSFSNVVSATEPNTVTSRWAYDAWGRATFEQRPDGNGVQWQYALCGTCPLANAAYLVTQTRVPASTSTPI